jgi:hypothetical protein
MNFSIVIAFSLLISLECYQELNFESINETEENILLFDTILYLTHDCQTRARDSAIKCELDTCHILGWVRCDGDPPTNIISCKDFRSIFCFFSNSKVIKSFCSEKDQEIMELFEAHLAELLVSHVCKELNNKSFVCNEANNFANISNSIQIVSFVLFILNYKFISL